MITKVKNLLKHPLFSGSFIMVAGGMVVNVVNYLYHLVMGRVLGPVDYGSLASVFSILYIVSIVPMSTSFAIVKFISAAKNDKEKSEIYHGLKRLLLYIAVGALLILLVLSPVLTNFLNLDSVMSVIFVGPTVFFSLLTLVNQASLQGELKFEGVVLPNLSSGIGKLIFGILLVYLGFSVPGAIFAVFLSQVITYFYSRILVGSRFKKEKESSFNLKEFLGYAFPVLLQALAFTAFFTVDLILVKHFLPPFEAGLYAALSTLGKIIYFATSPVTATMFPIVSKRRSRGERYEHVFFAAFFATISVSLGIVAIYWLLPNLTIGLLYGSKYLAAKSELVWMGLFMAVYTACYAIVNFLLSINKTKIVILPILALLAQITGILIWHSSILIVIQVSLISLLALLSSLSLYLGYNQFQRVYGKKN